MLNLKINSEISEPIYRQIADQLLAAIKSGKLEPGARLPPERALASRLGVARGTVKKAYETLATKGFVLAARGRGSVVAAGESARSEGSSRMEKATDRILSLIKSLEELRFSYRDISGLFGLILAQREEEVSHFSIAVIDCNVEALGVYHKQLAILTQMTTAKFLLDDIKNNSAPAAKLEPFDLVLTTAKHVEELRNLAPEISYKIIPVVVSPSQDTLFALAKLRGGSRVGIIHKTKRFCEIVSSWLNKSGFIGSVEGFDCSTSSAEEFDSFLRTKEIVIVPPGSTACFSNEFVQILNDFRRREGRTINFTYQIEEGSLFHLQALIKNLLEMTRKRI
ncbi:MAG: GntR family transcriptional regulator [Candidatus Rifleibacteriota bacterium]